ncbi:hypothetical protein CTA1_5352 [Colletotrichum tanaceti]|uniref:Uncharacterized protein n=1 Tax=Colletotrichum tanaceti TaxID=1306861 RepID=A0A4U6XGM9_9PEZI|nr:hypothetical protein CTA1_5352 [Colletotrichum tanaceti]
MHWREFETLAQLPHRRLTLLWPAGLYNRTPDSAWGGNMRWRNVLRLAEMVMVKVPVFQGQVMPPGTS